MDHPHALAIVIIATPMEIIPIKLLGDIRISLKIFKFRWIVDVVVVVVVVVYGFFPIECLADVAHHDSALPRFRVFLEENRGQVK